MRLFVKRKIVWVFSCLRCIRQRLEKTPLVRRPFVTVACVFAAGIYACAHISVSLILSGFALFLFLLCAAVFIRREIVSRIFLVLVIFLTGALHMKSRTTVSARDVSHVFRYYANRQVEMMGRVISDVGEKSFRTTIKTSFQCRIRALRAPWGWQETRGKVLVNIFRKTPVRCGDFVILQGRLHFPFSGDPAEKFSYRDFLARKNIHHILSVKKTGKVRIKQAWRGRYLLGLIMRVRKDLQRVFHRYLTEDEAFILQAVILGVRQNVPKNIKLLFERTGVAHLLAISALHLGIVSFLVFLLIKVLPLPRRLQYGICIVFLLFYAVLTGARPSVVRATIMAIVVLLSLILEKESDLLNTLGLAGFILLWLNPQSLFDIGFQLSFLSVLSILLVFPRLKGLWEKQDPKPRAGFTGYLIQSFFVSLSAYTGVAGLVMYYFQILTPVAILINIVIIPLFSLLVMLGFGMLLVHFCLPQIAFFFALCIKVLLNVIVGITFLCAKIPGAYYRVENFSLQAVSLYYGVCGLLYVMLVRLNKKGFDR